MTLMMAPESTPVSRSSTLFFYKPYSSEEGKNIAKFQKHSEDAEQSQTMTRNCRPPKLLELIFYPFFSSVISEKLRIQGVNMILLISLTMLIPTYHHVER